MDKIQYVEKTAKAVMYYKNLQLEDLLTKPDMVNNFGLASFTLSHFLSSIDVSSHEAIIKDILAFQRITALGQQYPFISKDAILSENVKKKLAELKTSPQVIATFHYGSYRLINTLLLEHNVPFSLIISSATITEQSREFLRISEEVYNKPLTLIDAELPSCVISMIKEIKKGKSVVIYLDGNVGAGGNKAKEDNLCSIKFLDGNLHVRKGAAYLSHIAKVPIFAATCFLENYRDIYFDFSASITSDPCMDRETYALSAMQYIYTHFSNILKQHPGQWEAWFYLHKNIDSSLVPKKVVSNTNGTMEKSYDPGKSTKFNLKNFSLFKTGVKHYVLDKRTFLSYPLEPEAYNILFGSLVKPDFEYNTSKADLVNQLIKRDLFVQE